VAEVDAGVGGEVVNAGEDNGEGGTESSPRAKDEKIERRDKTRSEASDDVFMYQKNT
jgi:hypothetical protein